jgi:hypothetical protein
MSQDQNDDALMDSFLQDQRFDTLKSFLPFHLGMPSLYRIWRLNHHGGNHSLDPLNWDLQDFLGENISQGFLGRKYLSRILGRKYLSRSIKLGYWFLNHP